MGSGHARGPAPCVGDKPLSPWSSPPDPLLRRALRLTLVTDPEAAGPRGLEEVVERALRAGVTSVQLRDKRAGSGTLLPLALRLREQCRRHGALFVVNDRVDLALASGADAVHVGQADLPAAVVRQLVGESMVVGVSTATEAEARAAAEAGANYLGCGTIWPTDSKADAGEALGPDRLGAVVAATPLPVVAIGGITPERGWEALEAGAVGVAVIRAVLGASDPEAAVRAFLDGAQSGGSGSEG
jgi:thiamine-phosphate diphosphorylase